MKEACYRLTRKVVRVYSHSGLLARRENLMSVADNGTIDRSSDVKFGHYDNFLSFIFYPLGRFQHFIGHKGA
jgi:hypothetical protein